MNNFPFKTLSSSCLSARPSANPTSKL